MPLIKPISGHTNMAGVRRYLTKGDRALAADYLNLDYDSRIERIPGDLPVAYDWAREMDATRVLNNGNEPWRGKPARTYKHYIISPDPEDQISLDRLRELAIAWAQESFGDYQVAIVYHDDNEGHIPHAHVIVNNINLETGHRLQDPRPDLLNRRLQAMAKERSLKGFGVDEGMHDGFQVLAAKESGRKPSITRQRVYVRKAEAEITAKGKYSWLADIRSQVSVAKDLSSAEAVQRCPLPVGDRRCRQLSEMRPPRLDLRIHGPSIPAYLGGEARPCVRTRVCLLEVHAYRPHTARRGVPGPHRRDRPKRHRDPRPGRARKAREDPASQRPLRDRLHGRLRIRDRGGRGSR